MNFNELFQKMRELDAPVSEELKGGQKNLDADKDGDIEADDLKDLRDKKVDEELVGECGDMSMPSGMMGMRNPDQQDSISANISMNASGQGGIRDLMAILRNIENGGDEEHGSDEHDMAIAIDGMDDEPEALLDVEEADGGGFDRASTTPDPETAPMGAAFPKGNDISSHGGNERPKVNGGGNPYAMAAESLIPGLANLYQKVKLREGNGEQLDEFDVTLMQPTDAGFNSMFGANISGTPEVKAIIKTMKPEDYVETNKFKQEHPSADTYLEKNKWRDVVMGRQNQDMYNFVQRYNRDNNNLSIAQWLEKAKNSIKGAVTGQPAEPVSYDAARFDPTTAKTRGYGMDTTKPEKAFPMNESNNIIALSKMLNG